MTLFLAAGLVSCERQTAVREYEEITLASPLENLTRPQGNPHAFMGDGPTMGLDHPDISGALPEGHPDISGSMSMGKMPGDPQTQQALAASVAKAPLTWVTPDGWIEEAGSSMRVATFRVKDDAGGIECSIVSLGGQAGGYQSNVVRWMNQINIAIPPADQLENFIAGQESLKTEGGFSVKLIDLTGLAPEELSPSMIASIGELPDMTIFVKMTGARESLVKNRDKFKSLCASLKLK